jgi:hypothetical protein
MEVRVVREAGCASSAAIVGAELAATVNPKPMKNLEAMYIAAKLHQQKIRYWKNVKTNCSCSPFGRLRR